MKEIGFSSGAKRKYELPAAACETEVLLTVFYPCARTTACYQHAQCQTDLKLTVPVGTSWSRL